MSPIQQMLLGMGAVSKKTYMDEVFSTYLYKGTGSAQTINNGIDLAGEEGMTWIKSRSLGVSHIINDTVRGAGNRINSNGTSGSSSSTAFLSAFNSNGFSIGNDNDVSYSNQTFASWSFRKAPGFFTIKEYTGSGSTQSLTHDLGSVPGMIMVKRTDYVAAWAVYHRQANGGVDPEDYTAELNTSGGFYNDTMWGDTKPTSTHFTVGDAKSETNASGGTYIAYIFAGGESTAATARSVDFDGSDDYIRTPDHSDLDLDTNQFTIEMWVKSSTNPSSGNMNLVGQWGGNDRGYAVRYSLADQSFNGWGFQYCTNEQGSDVNTINGSTGIDDGQWHHLAVVRESSTIKLYTDGILSSSTSISGSLHITNSERDFYVGSDDSDNRYTGNVSNVRVVVGTALYTSSFKPPTEPLTNVTNTKLLCCNNSSVTGSTVSPGTIYSGGGPTASTDSPFDDPAGFVFGDAGDQNVIKCGSYTGAAAAETINLGFEPQWVMVKCTNNSTAHSNWHIYDSMRGVVTGGNDAALSANLSASESATYNYYSSNNDLIEFTPTGFIADPQSQNFTVNGSQNKNYIYMAIRRPDGYVGKPPALGTGVFNIDLAGINAGDPSWVSGFPVDMQFIKDRAGTTYDWFLSTRLTQGKYLSTTSPDAETANSVYSHDYQNGWGNYSSSDAELITSWMWKRHAGFDVVTYPISSGGGIRHQKHSLGKVPEMIFMKDRDNGDPFIVYHKGLNGGTNPKDYYMTLESSNSESNLSNFWGNSVSDINATSFFINQQYRYTGNHIAMLFASVDGISKVDGYDGDTNAQDKTISCGFQPRFVIAKCSTVGGSYNHWFVFDSVRGAGSGNDKTLRLDVNEAQTTNQDIIEFNSNGFIVKAGYQLNEGSRKYIYYAHA